MSRGSRLLMTEYCCTYFTINEHYNCCLNSSGFLKKQNIILCLQSAKCWHTTAHKTQQTMMTSTVVIICVLSIEFFVRSQNYVLTSYSPSNAASNAQCGTLHYRHNFARNKINSLYAQLLNPACMYII